MTNGQYPGRGGRDEDVWDISENQTRYLMDNFPDAAVFPVRVQDDSRYPVEFLYRRRHLVTREQDVSRVEEVLGAREHTIARGAERFDIANVTHPIPGLALIELDGSGDDPGDDGRTLFAALLSIRAILGPTIAAPDHLVHLTPSTGCPATEPEPAIRVDPQPGVSRSRCDGRGTLVVVVDSGLVPGAADSHSWMRGVTGDDDTEVRAPQAADQPPVIVDRYGGHGTFIASIVRAMAPRAEVRVPRYLKRGAAIYETDLVAALLPVLDWAPDVISLSAGTHTWLDEGLLSFQVFVPGPLRAASGTVLVAAAGNDGRDWKFAPAEMDGVIGVGALGAPGDALAWFSDFGDWVDVYAPGEDLVHAFPPGVYTYAETPGQIGQQATFTGMARWSGTSFSTPVVAGLIAARMSGTGESSREAADALLRLARAQALPGVGPVLRPGQACLGAEWPGC